MTKSDTLWLMYINNNLQYDIIKSSLYSFIIYINIFNILINIKNKIEDRTKEY